MIGQGYDLHKLAPGKSLILGGVEIPGDRGTIAHSDGDVLLHAICDAILGAAALGDIGKHFPDNNQEFKDISSMELLTRVMSMFRAAGHTLINIDATVILESPRIGTFTESMRENISTCTGVAFERISIKAKTNEGVDAVGEGRAIACYAVVMAG